MVIAKKAAMILAAAMLLCALMCGCGGGSELRHVTLNEVTRSVFYAPLYCAVSLGYFEKEGLDVEIVTSGGSDKSMTALISVSYTHLDVYKRQTLPRNTSPTSMSLTILSIIFFAAALAS